MEYMEWYVGISNDLYSAPDRAWNCEDSENEANRVYEYFKSIYNHVVLYHDGTVIHDHKRYPDGTEEET